MVGQNVGQLCLVLRLQERVQSAFGKGSKSLIGWSKHGERAWRSQCLCQVGGNHSCNQSGEILDRLRQLNNVGKISTKIGRGQHHAINDVCNSVACQVVSTNHLPQALEVGSHLHTGRVLQDVQVLSLDCGHTLEEFQISGEDLRWKHMVGQNVGQLCLVLRLQERVQSAFGKGSKSLIGWSKHGERAWRSQCLCQVGGNHSCNQSGEILDRLRQLNNVGKISTKIGRGQHHAINDVCNSVACQVVSPDHLPQVVEVWPNMHTGRGLQNMEVLTLNSCHPLEELQVSGQHLLREHMISQNVNQLGLVLWLHERVQRAFREGSKSFICWSKHCERARRRKRFCQVRCNHS